MTVLVAYASEHGATQEIAEFIGTQLTDAHLDVDVQPVTAIDALESYQAVVLGSAVHNGAWLPEATEFVTTNTAMLAVLPLWLFSVGSVGETSSFFGPRVSKVMRRARREPRSMAAIRIAVRPRAHRSFAGAVGRHDWGLLGTLFLRACGGSYGDHRDWTDIASWTASIAATLDHSPRARR